jgi:formate-dependent nitrite reductase membrane component NrfD
VTANGQTGDIAANAENAAGYYGLPVIHGPHWQWHIAAYFFLGGISGTSAALAAISRLLGGRTREQLSTAATFIAFATLLPCPILLVLDLGRPRRFFNMMRVFRPSSPMSVGSWGLFAFGASLSASMALQIAASVGGDRHPHTRRSLALVERVVVPCAGLTGLFVASYTGTLLAATAVPLWAKRPALLGPLFLSSAATSGAAAVAAVIALNPDSDPQMEAGLRRLELMTALAEGTALTAWLYALGPTARPLLAGRLGTLVREIVMGTGIALPLVIGALSTTIPPPARRVTTLLSSALTLLGGYALRYAVVTGGRESADDPRATFQLTN